MLTYIFTLKEVISKSIKFNLFKSFLHKIGIDIIQLLNFDDEIPSVIDRNDVGNICQ